MIPEKFFAYLSCMITYGLLSLLSIIVLIRTFLYGQPIFKRFTIRFNTPDLLPKKSSYGHHYPQPTTPLVQPQQQHDITSIASSMSLDTAVSETPDEEETERTPIYSASSINRPSPVALTTRPISKSAPVPKITYETSSSFTDKKLIVFLILCASVVRFVQFTLQTFVQHFQVYRSMEILVSTLPAAIFVSIELLLIFFWAEIVHHKKKSHLLKIVFILMNMCVYLFLLVCDCLLVYQVRYYILDCYCYSHTFINSSLNLIENKHEWTIL
jgi:hypothetical protein